MEDGQAIQGAEMKILVTNDDGINAPGLRVLEQIAREIAGPEGKVITVAPAFEQSGVGHCISYTKPMMISEMSEGRWAAEGSPADCVLAGLHDVLGGAAPDLVLSGVNRGNNAAENVLYSGTVGGAIEAALQGVPAIAMSQFFGPGNADPNAMFDAAARFGADTIRAILDAGLWDHGGYMTFYNVNFPPCPADAVQGRKVVRQGWREGAHFAVEPALAPSGRRFLWIKGGPQQIRTDPGTDVAANLDGYISITPMRVDLTAHDMMDALEEALS